MPSFVQDLVGKMPLPPTGGGPGPLPPHLLAGGVSFSFLTWLADLKHMLLAVLEPIKDCKSILDAFFVYLHLDNERYMGIGVQIAIFVFTTYVLIELVRMLFKTRNNSHHKDEKDEPSQKDPHDKEK